MFLEAEEMILPEEPLLPVNPMAHQQKIWDLYMTAMIKMMKPCGKTCVHFMQS